MIAADANTPVSRNLWKILTMKFLGEFLPVAPVLILFYTANGLNSTQIFTIQAIFHLGVLLLEVPSGYLADVIGRRRTLIFGAVFYPLGVAAYTLGHSFGAFVLAELTWAVSVSMRSGCDSAMLFDSLRQLGRENEYKRYEGKCALVARTGTAVSSVVGGLLASVFLRLPFLVNLASAMFMPALAISLVGMAGSVIFIVVSPLFGRLVDAVSLSVAFIALGVFFFLAGMPLLASMLRHWQEA